MYVQCAWRQYVRSVEVDCVVVNTFGGEVETGFEGVWKGFGSRGLDAIARQK